MNALVSLVESQKKKTGSYPQTIDEVNFAFERASSKKSLVRFSIVKDYITGEDELLVIFQSPDTSKGYVYTSTKGWRFIDD